MFTAFQKMLNATVNAGIIVAFVPKHKLPVLRRAPFRQLFDIAT
jgi:hypothetical protein